MTNRNPLVVVLLTFITLGIYGLVWYVKTGREMRSKGASIPTAWIILIPLVGLYWQWKWSEGVGIVTGDKLSGPVAFLLTLCLGPIGMAVIQSQFNKC